MSFFCTHTLLQSSRPLAQSASSLQSSGWSGLWGAVDAVSALLPLPVMTRFGLGRLRCSMCDTGNLCAIRSLIC
jgi:hypothetical protein